MSFNKDLYKLRGGMQRMYESFDSHLPPIAQLAVKRRPTNLEAMSGRKNGDRHVYSYAGQYEHADGGAGNSDKQKEDDTKKESDKESSLIDKVSDWFNECTCTRRWIKENMLVSGMLALVIGSYVFRRRASIEQQLKAAS
jgi:hypothetical protein